MAKFILVRLLGTIPVLLGVSILVFSMVRLVPGDPIDMMFSNLAPPSPEQKKAIRHDMGLDRPVYLQYASFVSNALRGDLGKSYRTKRPVSEEIRNRLPNTIKLTLASLAVSTLIGVVAGVVAATFKNTWIDFVSMVVAIIGVSIPGFWLGLMIMMLFSVKLGWFPVAGAETWKHLVLPTITLGVLASAILARMTRSAMLDVLNQDYVRTARAKGLREWRVIMGHAFRNALVPIITILGLQIGGLLSGAFIIESVFAYPGIGMLAVQALATRDFPLIQGIVLLVAVIYVLVNLAVDMLYSVFDPRVRNS
ncbi:MAG TPA: ABC transporter permease [Thermomicrobiales bacterium]|jgi:ABC-type dipeptide/oligopeptide/nickel transport system permease component|nr:peptide ABC transporter permease [Chloroflexota bacterium]HCG28587.1 peptide ABC transporter permease [Chloroflexota bacterium]HQX63251.1 ABC transporter permease [Thermomicrobiales bacterium]HQZ91191.1 ABC transporter permease [Thermomicrobiales bacterium]HRA33167.1 ABC transporter permease [Thermomicrobiales bacterium]